MPEDILLNETVDTIASYTSKIYKVISETDLSLSKFIKPAFITAPVFIDNSLFNENILQHINKTLFNLYASMILVALKLDSYVSSSRTVRDLIGRVATSESYLDMDTVLDLITKAKNTKYISSLESRNEKLEGITQKYLSGRLIEVDLSVKDLQRPFSTYLYCQFYNRVLNSSFISKLLEAMNTDTKYRFMMWRANEISFWKDLVFQMDIIENKMKILKHDDEGVFANLLKNHNQSLFKKIIQICSGKPSTVNVRNNIYIIDENRFKTVCTKCGYNFKKETQVQTFMRNIKALFLVTVDTLQQEVIFHIFGINYPSKFTFKELMKYSSGNNNQMDILNILEMLKKGVI